MLSFVQLRRGLVVGVAALTVAGATPAAGDTSRGGWLPPVAELGPYESYFFSVAAAPTGDAVVAWADTDGVGTTSKRPGSSWGEPSRLVDDLTAPSVAFDAAGNAVLAALQHPDGVPTNASQTVAFARPVWADTWMGPVVLSGVEYDAFVAPALAVSDSGEAVVAWLGKEGGLYVVRAAVRGRDGTWSHAENLGYAGYLGNHSPSVAIDDHGDAVAVWSRGPEDAANVYAEVRPAGEGWQPVQVLSTRADGRLEWKVVMSDRGDALAVWAELEQPERATLYSARLAAGATTWSKPVPIPISDGFDAAGAWNFFSGSLSFALDAAGNATLVAATHQVKVEAATLAAGSETWQGPVVIGDGGNGKYTHSAVCLDPQVGVDDNGGAVAIWGGASLFAARRQPGEETWDRPVQVALGPTCFARYVATDRAGNAVAVWNAGFDAGTEEGRRLDAAVFDATPPVLERLAPPARAPVAARVRFSVAVSDSWSKLARQPPWQFGDGTSARGLVVRHAYRRRGRFSVTVTAEDLAGNEAASTVAVLVRKRIPAS